MPSGVGCTVASSVDATEVVGGDSGCMFYSAKKSGSCSLSSLVAGGVGASSSWSSCHVVSCEGPFGFKHQHQLVVVEFLKEAFDCRGVRFCQGLEVLGEVFLDHLYTIFVHFVETATFFLSILDVSL